MFIKDDSIIQTLSGKSYGHKSEKAFIYAHFYSLKQVSKLFISRDIDDFASGDFSYLGPLYQLYMIKWKWRNSNVFNVALEIYFFIQNIDAMGLFWILLHKYIHVV